MKTLGRPVKTTRRKGIYRVAMSICFDPKILKQLDKKAKKQKTTRSGFLETILKKYLQTM